MMSALQIETDSQNTHMLLGGLLLCVQDSVSFEESDLGASDGQSTSARETNLLSSGKKAAKISYHLLSVARNFKSLFQILFIHTFIYFLRKIPITIHFHQSIRNSACSERSAYSIASGASNSSYGNSSTATMSNEPTSLLSDDLMPEDFDGGAYGKLIESLSN